MESIENIFVARQPIYDAKQNLIGYELLYRDGDVEQASFADGKQASSEVIMNIFMNVGIDALVGSAKAFINITEDFILDETFTPMFENQVVLEILENIYPSSEIISGVKRLKQQGYEIALDDFKYNPDFDDLLELADYVKVDVLELDRSEIDQQLLHLKKFNLKLVAEKVETTGMYEASKEQGFNYYQGFYFCKPQLVKKRNIPANKLVVINLLAKLQEPDFSFDELEKILAHDATLTYKILRYVNSAAFSHRKEISSIKEALILVGANTISKWASLIFLMQLSEGKPRDLLITALVRARMCELLADLEDLNSHQMFTIGLLSILDVLMDMSMEDILDELAVTTEIKMALLDYSGKQGAILNNILLYEQARWNELVDNNVDSKDYYQAYIDAIKWSDTVISL